jgi:hypothetical protein
MEHIEEPTTQMELPAEPQPVVEDDLGCADVAYDAETFNQVAEYDESERQLNLRNDLEIILT